MGEDADAKCTPFSSSSTTGVATPPSSEEIVRKCRENAITILREDYPAVKDGVLALEVFMRRKSRKAVYELREFLSQLAKIFEYGISSTDAEHNVSECRTHLRRCIVEPLEYKAEKGFVRLHRISFWFGWVIWRAPQAHKDFHHNMVKIKHLIAEGRQVKTEGKAAVLFREAFELVEDLKAEVGPLWFVTRAIIGLIVVFLCGWAAEAGKDSYVQWHQKHTVAIQASPSPTNKTTPSPLNPHP